MRRRAFVHRLPVLAAGLPGAARALIAGTAAALSAGGCGGVRYVVARTAPGRLRIDAAELPPAGELFLQAPGMDRPVYLRRDPSGELVALLARCTHRGCQPGSVAGRLVCPCHGSEFSLLGEVLAGPAERPLTRYRATEEGGEIVVHVGEEGVGAGRAGGVGPAGGAGWRSGSMRSPNRASAGSRPPRRSTSPGPVVRFVAARAAVPATALLSAILFAAPALGQVDTTRLAGPDTAGLAQGGIYDRPFIGSMSSTSLGGYVEGNTNYFVEDGVSEGFSMELRRFNIFLFSQISPRVRFLSELEFEHGTEEIALETALVDVRVLPALTLRAGIILPPIGYFNQNHDSPRWDFVERPLVSTTIIPSTLSEVGGGVLGRFALAGGVASYDAYLTNGLGDGVVGNGLGRTDIPSGKTGELLGEDNNGSPAFSGRLAFRRPGLGEAGLSYYGGYYNSFRVEGEEVDARRWMDITALDAGASVGAVDVRAELAYATVDVPPALDEVFGDTQWGAHLDVVVPLWRPGLDGYEDAVLAGAVRLERVDYNVGTFSSTGAGIGDEVSAVVLGLSFRPGPGTVFRANYRRHWTRDFARNPVILGAGFQLGFATYF